MSGTVAGGTVDQTCMLSKSCIAAGVVGIRVTESEWLADAIVIEQMMNKQDMTGRKVKTGINGERRLLSPATALCVTRGCRGIGEGGLNGQR